MSEIKVIKAIVATSGFRCGGKLVKKGEELTVGTNITKSDAKAMIANRVAVDAASVDAKSTKKS